MPDHAALIRDLQQRGVTRPQIARATGLSKATIHRLCNDGCRDMESTVGAIERLHEKIVGKGKVTAIAGTIGGAGNRRGMFHGQPGGR